MAEIPGLLLEHVRLRQNAADAWASHDKWISDWCREREIQIELMDRSTLSITEPNAVDMTIEQIQQAYVYKKQIVMQKPKPSQYTDDDAYIDERWFCIQCARCLKHQVDENGMVYCGRCRKKYDKWKVFTMARPKGHTGKCEICKSTLSRIPKSDPPLYYCKKCPITPEIQSMLNKGKFLALKFYCSRCGRRVSKTMNEDESEIIEYTCALHGTLNHDQVAKVNKKKLTRKQTEKYYKEYLEQGRPSLQKFCEDKPFSFSVIQSAFKRFSKPTHNLPIMLERLGITWEDFMKAMEMAFNPNNFSQK